MILEASFDRAAEWEEEGKGATRPATPTAFVSHTIFPKTLLISSILSQFPGVSTKGTVMKSIL